MERDVGYRARGGEFDVQRGCVSLEGQTGRGEGVLVVAGLVCRVSGRGVRELGACGHAVRGGEVGGRPEGQAGRIAVVGAQRVGQGAVEVELLAWVVLVNVGREARDLVG